jgi:hypothetical protein
MCFAQALGHQSDVVAFGCHLKDCLRFSFKYKLVLVQNGCVVAGINHDVS